MNAKEIIRFFLRLSSMSLILFLASGRIADAVFGQDNGGSDAVSNVQPPPPTESVPILKAAGLFDDPSQMVRNGLISEIDAARLRWQESYDKLKTASDIEIYQKERQDFFFRQLGEMWERTPLKPRVTGRLTKPDYRVEKLVLETLPNFYATGTCFLPKEEKFPPPYPGVLIVCGHSRNGKASELYQGICVLGAMNGLAMFILDPIDQGERFQHLNDEGEPYLFGTAAHNLVGAGSILLGRNTATFEVWDMIRGLDYLQSRPDVIPDRLGVAGNSGGGTQSSYLMALDDRVACAAPSCYLCGLYGAQTHSSHPQDAEQNIFGQLGFGMDHVDYVIMRAPKPTLMNTRTDDFFNIEDAWQSFRGAKRIYSRFGLSEKIGIIEIEGEHGYCPAILDASVRWMLRWLAGRDELIVGPDPLPILTEEEICSTENGIMSLPNARTTYDLNRDLNKTLAERRRVKLASITPEEFADLVRAAARFRRLSELPEPEVVTIPNAPAEKILRSGEGIYLPLSCRWTESGGPTARLIVSSAGRRSETAEALFAEFRPEEGPVYSVELRGWGETRGKENRYFNKDYFGPDGAVWYLAYLLGKSYVGMRAEDLLVTARYVRETTGKGIEVIADSPSAGLVVLHAAAAEPGLFEKVVLSGEEIPAWSSLVEKSPTAIRITDIVHGVLNHYDVDDLIRFVRPVRQK